MQRRAGGLAQTLCLNVCDAPTAQFGQIAPLALTCNVPSGHRRPHTSRFAPAKDGVRESEKPTAESSFLREQSENVYENKQSSSSRVEGVRSCGVNSRGGSDGDGLSLLNPRLSTCRLEFDGTKRECL